jgi:amphi-Trp domain-containing protein
MMPARAPRDVEKVTSRAQFVEKLRRLADALEAGQPFTIQVANERFTVPAGAEMSVEHERGEEGEELELQLRWERQR